MDLDASVYFAYGANMNRHHMALWCPNSTPLEPAVLPGFRMVFRFWCDLLEQKAGQVPGALYRLGPGDLKWLDQYEDSPRLYEHQMVRVRAQDGREIEAMTYRMRGGHPFAPPDREYIEIVRQGYVDWGYDAKLLPEG